LVECLAYNEKVSGSNPLSFIKILIKMGALTLKVFSDELREWEFIEGEGIDPTDSFGVSLRLSVRENQIFLAEPSEPSTPWLTDRGRLFFDGMFEKSSSSDLTDWEVFFDSIAESMYFIDHLNLQRRNASSFLIVFENLSMETLNMLYLLEQSCSVIKLKKAESHSIPNDFESQYQLAESTQKPKLHMSTLGILLNTNTRHEGYVLNLSLRQRFLKGDFKLLSIGSMLDLTFPTHTLGSNLNVFKAIGEGTHLSCQDLKNAEFPVLIANTELFKRSDSKNIVKILKHTNIVTSAWNGLNLLHHNISSTGISLLNNFLPISNEDFVNFFGLYFINVSLSATPNFKKLTELQLLNTFSSKNSLNYTVFVDQNNSAERNKIVYDKVKLNLKAYNNYFYLPNNLFLEDNETYVNTQGLIKRTTKLINFKKDAKSNWQITRKFYANSKKIAFFNNKKDNELINFNCVNLFHFKNYANFQYYASQTLTSLSFYLTKQSKPIVKSLNTPIKSTQIKLLNTKLKGWLDDFFSNNGKDSFSYNSSVLVNCSKVARISSTNFF
jgi:NADH dehydrogenase/NADH:ubiquinone oxidoreductase subunit G